jgi:ribonuclease HII
MARLRSDSPPLFDLPLKPDFSAEQRARQRGAWPVAGTDEAGRGPLAGPVVAAAVILDPKSIPEGLDDSKRMTHEAREAVYLGIIHSAFAVSVASVCAGSIDRSDIRKASLEAMRRAVASLAMTPALVLADGRDIPPGLPCECKALIKGDQRSQSIAAASIVAKVTRDRMLSHCGSIHPGYGFERHAGYGTELHLAGIQAHGPLPGLHRMTFSPFRTDGTRVAAE